MKYTSPTLLFLSILIGLSWASCTEDSKKLPKEKPNIIILLADDLGWNDVGYHGSDIRTPYIDKFVKEGVELDRFYTYFSCTPARVGLLTGRYPGRTGLSKKVITPERKDGLSPDEILIPEVLEKAGYKRRACIGKWHLGHSHVKYHPNNQGFTYFYGHYGGQLNYFTHKRRKELDWHKNFDACYDEGYTTTLLTKEAVKFIEESPTEEPFFLYVPFNAPHTPLQAEDKFLRMSGFDKNKDIFSLQGKEKPDTLRPIHMGQGNTKRQTYKAMVSAMDEGIGKILEAVDKKGLKENTLVIFYSDNGASKEAGGDNKPFRGGKGSCFEGGLRVPAALRWPAAFEGGKKIEATMGYIDIFPTILEIVQEGSSHHTDGQSLVNVLLNQKDESLDKRALYFGPNGLLEDGWKLANNKLFNLKTDPRESHDMSKKERERFNQMSQKLKDLSSEIEVNMEPDMSYELHKEWKMPGGE